MWFSTWICRIWDMSPWWWYPLTPCGCESQDTWGKPGVEKASVNMIATQTEWMGNTEQTRAAWWSETAIIFVLGMTWDEQDNLECSFGTSIPVLPGRKSVLDITWDGLDDLECPSVTSIPQSHGCKSVEKSNLSWGEDASHFILEAYKTNASAWIFGGYYVFE